MTDVLLPEVVVQSIRKCLTESRTSNEHGGILLGLRKGSAVQIESATLPQKWDYATPFLFKRSARGHAEIANKEWLRSGHTVDWVGEWHSHPPGFPNPSMTDRLSWAQIAKKTRRPMVFIIFSGPAMYVGLQPPHLAAAVQLRESECISDTSLYERN